MEILQIGNTNTKYSRNGYKPVDFTKLINTIKKRLKYNEDRDEDFYRYTSRKNISKFNIASIDSINEFYKHIRDLKKTSFKNKREIISSFVEKEYYDKINYTFQQMKEYPKYLVDYGISFKMIDDIALKNEWWTQESDLRHEMYMIIIMEDISEQRGHVYAYPEYIEDYIDEKDYHLNKRKLFKLMENKQFTKENEICVSNGGKFSLKKYKLCEERLEKQIHRLAHKKYDSVTLTHEDFENLYPDGKKLSSKQLKSINYILKYYICAVIGKGGTGKTSWVVKYLCKYLISQNPNEDILFFTPTHAAKNRGKDELIELSDNIKAGTLHSYTNRYIRADDEEWTSKLNEALNSGSKYIIVDEMSMVDLPIFSNFIEICHIYDNLHIVLLGDNNQLYPVGVGCPFRDLINCKMIKKIELTKNYRSTGDIVPFCEDILCDNGWTLFHNKSESLTNKYTNDISYNFTKSYDETDEQFELLLDKLKQDGYVPYSYDKNNPKAFQIITYQNDDCIEYAKLVRNLYSDEEECDLKFKEDDPIIIKKTDIDRDIHNGDDGVILDFIGDYDYRILYTNSENEESEIILTESEIKPALARTVHSSQGLQFPVVIYVGKNVNRLDLNINYTAYSRAKEKLYLIGLIDCFNGKNARKKSEERNTFINLNYMERTCPEPE
jgi:ATP-dependent exoDNAse (exonuclease V) alpha subunit